VNSFFSFYTSFKIYYSASSVFSSSTSHSTIVFVSLGSGPNVFGHFVPADASKTINRIPQTKGTSAIKSRRPLLFISCNLLTPTEIEGIRVTNNNNM